MASTKLFALLAVGVIIAMASVGLFLAGADSDYKFAISETADSPPDDMVVTITPYDGLSDRQRQIFDRAVEGETVRFEESSPMPRIVERDGTYYISEAPRYYDWTNPRTFGPLILFLVGAAISVQAVRMDIRS
jgi:hypothetical protein